MTDGFVQFISDQFDFLTFQRLCTKADGFVTTLP